MHSRCHSCYQKSDYIPDDNSMFCPGNRRGEDCVDYFVPPFRGCPSKIKKDIAS